MRDIDVRQQLYSSEISVIVCEDPSTLVVDELGLLEGDHRIDVAVINGLMHGYEIKSASDTLERLPDQASCYSQIFDRMTLVVAECHAERAFALVPDWWGRMIVTTSGGEHALLTTKQPGNNQNVNAYSLAQLLWKEEALAELQRRGFPRSLKSKPRKALWRLLSEVSPIDELRDYVRLSLKKREHWRAVP